MAGRLTICGTCDGPGAEIAARVAAPGWEVCLHDCFAACADPVAMSVQAEGRATYLFSGIAVDDIADIRAFLDLYEAAPRGWIEDARPAGRLRFCLRGRVPAL